jgi:DNA-binding LacI/PurR family transcriptional regulator
VRRPTLDDVAAKAGVSRGAVSFALNERPGVSPETRARILRVAAEIGYAPNWAATALKGGRARAIGLAINRSQSTLATESYYMELIAGIESELANAPGRPGLLLALVPGASVEIDTYRTWWSQGRVDGLFVIDVRQGDRRLAALRELGLPTVVLGEPANDHGLPTLSYDEEAAMREVCAYLVWLGHRRIAFATGIPTLRQTALRRNAFLSTASELGFEPTVVAGDNTGESGARTTHEILSIEWRPTAIVYDNDAMAASGTVLAQKSGIAVPDDLSIISMSDSRLCELVQPAISAIHRDMAEYAATAARLLLATLAGAERAPTLDIGSSRIVLRGSTGAAKV